MQIRKAVFGFSKRPLRAAAMAAGLLALVTAAPVWAKRPAPAPITGVFVVHGIPGAEGFPVDVSVDGTCALEGLTFGQIVGAVPLVGTVTLAVHPVSAAGPCAAAPALGPVALTFEADESYSVVAHLDAAGAPTASVFGNEVSRPGPGLARVIAHHTAEAPPVDITISRAFFARKAVPRVVVEDVENGEQTPSLTVRPGDWQVAISPAGVRHPVFGPITLTLEPHRTYLVYAVGSLDDGTFTPLIKAIEAPRPTRPRRH